MNLIGDLRAKISLFPEHQRRELMETTPPGLPLVGRVWRLVIDAVDTRLLKRGHLFLAFRATLAAAVADEDKAHLLLERGDVSDVVGGDAAAAENADVR